MGAALDLAADLKRTKGTATVRSGGAQAGSQNPNRKPCKKCKRWRYVWDTCTGCGAPPLQKRPSDRNSAPAPPRRRVQEVVVQEVTENPDLVDDDVSMGEGEDYVEAGVFAEEEQDF